jgi:hypothetical protein
MTESENRVLDIRILDLFAVSDFEFRYSDFSPRDLIGSFHK